METKFTGLTDKNEVRIYVGDILQECFYISTFTEKVIDHFEAQPLTDETPMVEGEWEPLKQEEVFTVTSLENIHKRIFELAKIVVEEDKNRLCRGGFFEVIGNVCENPRREEARRYSKPSRYQ